MTTRIAVIGVGAIATQHLISYQNNPQAELVAVCDIDRTRAKARADEFDVPRATDVVEEILTDPEVDAVSICVPNLLHAKIAEAALRAGKDVLVEKPMSVTVDEAEALVRATQETGQALQIGYVRRFAPNALVTKRFLDEGEFGDIYAARATIIRAAGNPGGWFGDVDISGGGPLIDLGVHIIDLCWYLMGMPAAVSASGATFSTLGARDNIQHLSRYRAASASRVNPRGARIVALEKPTAREQTQWYFQRYVEHLPAAGEMVLFDRSWYNRACVERVMGFCTQDEYEEFMRQAPEFERMLVRSGILLVKLWFSVSQAEQQTRFTIRQIDPVRQWKLSPTDLASLDKWADYTEAKESMFHYTDTPHAPWTVVKSNDKKRARLEAVRHVLSLYDYSDKDHELVGHADRKILGPAAEVLEHGESATRVFPVL